MLAVMWPFVVAVRSDPFNVHASNFLYIQLESFWWVGLVILGKEPELIVGDTMLMASRVVRTRNYLREQFEIARANALSLWEVEKPMDDRVRFLSS